jgi:serine/threonine protein kinase
LDSDRTADSAQAAPPPLSGAPASVGEVVDGRWRVSQVHRGGQAWVLIADDLDSGTRRAIKVPLHGNALAGDSELAMLLDLKPHPHVVSALDVVQIGGSSGIVFEFMPSTFAALRTSAPSLPLCDRLSIALQHVCAGFEHLSAVTQTAHLDLKPSNVLIDDAGRARIADFGLAQHVRIRDGRFPAARGGTWAYAAPEVLRNEPCDTRADIFSFGIMLYEACTGQLPYPFPLATDPAAQRTQLVHYYASPQARRRTEEFYYWDQLSPTQFPVGLTDDNMNVLLSGCLMLMMDERHQSFARLAPLLARTLPAPILLVAPAAPLPAADQQRRELALCWTLIRLSRYAEAVTRLNDLLASQLPSAFSAEALRAAREALIGAGRPAEAAALSDWR